MARLKLKLWDSVISDCRTCLDLSPDNMKAYYYLSQAELALNDFNQALEDAYEAHRICVSTGDKSLQSVTTQVLRCKKERWEDAERRRAREGGHLELIVRELMKREREAAMKEAEDERDRQEISDEWDQKLGLLSNIFEKARSASDKKRTVPDWVVDDISFSIMTDPVIVSSDLGTHIYIHTHIHTPTHTHSRPHAHARSQHTLTYSLISGVVC